MKKRKKIPEITYHFERSDREITYEDIKDFSYETIFYVREDGLVVRITKDTNIAALAKGCNYIFMYRDQLIEMLFIN